jgi:predicted component of type VI protein secretion system
VLVGREPPADVVLDGLLSRRQTFVDFMGDVCLLTDAESTSGTYVNECCVGYGKTSEPLRAGDQVRLGGIRFDVRFDPGDTG